MDVHLSLLGDARLTVDGRHWAWGHDRRYLLLAFVACHPGGVSREVLQDVFWPESAPEAARTSLRQLISRVRALNDWPGLEIQRGRLRWEVKTDVASVLTAVHEGRWAGALSGYGGPLLASVTDSSEALSAWLELERGRLRGAWRLAALQRGRELSAGGWHLEAADLLKSVLDTEDLDEVVLRAYVDALLDAGGRDRALLACEAFVRRLRDDLNLAPTADLIQLIHTLRSPEEPTVPAALPVQPGAPTPALLTVTTSFVGRSTELAELRRLFAQPDCRLLTLTGPGGIGKTRLALQAARQLAPDSPGGVYHVPLAGLTDPTLIPSSIADGMGVLLRGPAPALTQVVRAIGDRHVLLVLDNYEHVLEGAGVAAGLIGACPNLRLLVTSRERLGVEGEWLLILGGLEYPDTPDIGVVEGRYFDAVQLFEERARRVRTEFAVDAAERPHVWRLCQLVEGSPLALELAAVWVRSLPLAEIVREIERSLDFLTAGQRSHEARHHSLRAVFESSWARLTPVEQETLRRTSVFRGGFGVEAAQVVVGASPAVLASLIDRSLLRLGPHGRYSRHAQLYQYMVEKLAAHPQEEAEVGRRHGRYYLGLLARQGDAILGPGGRAALASLDEEQDNIRVAWTRAATSWPEDLGTAVVQGALYHDRRARFQEGLAAYATAAQALDETWPSQRALLGEILIRQGWFAMRLGRQPEARRLAGRGLKLVPAHGPPAMHGHNALGNIAERTGAYQEAETHFREAIRLARQHDFPHREADLTTHLALVETALGHYARADATNRRAMALYARLEYHVGTIFGLTQRGYLELAQGRLDRATDLFQQGLTLARHLGVRQRVPDCLHGLAEIAYQSGQLNLAQDHAHEELTLAETEGNPGAQVAALGLLGRVAAARREEARAATRFAQALHLAQELDEWPRLLEVLLAVASWDAGRGEASAASPLLRTVLEHPATGHPMRVVAQQLSSALTAEPRGLDGARDPADLAEIVASTLGRLLPLLDWTLATPARPALHPDR